MNNYFIVYDKLPSLNEYVNACRRNPFVGASFKKKVEKTISKYINIYLERGILRKVDEPIIVFFTWSESTRRRDCDNIASAKKYILDAMQTCDIISNDNRKVVKGFRDDIIDGDEDYVLVEIIPAREITQHGRIIPGIIYLD